MAAAPIAIFNCESNSHASFYFGLPVALRSAAKQGNSQGIVEAANPAGAAIVRSNIAWATVSFIANAPKDTVAATLQYLRSQFSITHM